ncbi:unnamed protein product [Orchesella dallaii]|uniref:Uncharacterized protein n=1 Tax=Orchesella dallaii TaxID=48710 RepID=A0ABP1QIL2_9HEXA
MKLTPFLLSIGTATLFTIAVAYPSEDRAGSGIQAQCRLTSLSREVENAVESNTELDLENLQLPDPLIIKDQVLTYNDQSYSFKNGRITGLSTLDYDFNYDRETSMFNLNLTLESFSFSGNYEVKNGFIDLPFIGEHTFSGSGLVNRSLTGFKFALRIGIEADATSFKITSFAVGDGFTESFFQFGDSTIDGTLITSGGSKQVSWADYVQGSESEAEPLIWRTLNDQDSDALIEYINRFLQGCTILDLIGLLKP